MRYKHIEDGDTISQDEYDDLYASERAYYRPVQSGDFLTSAIIGAATGSALLGGLLGGDLEGGIVGDLLDGDLFD